jgi:small redox-active disulfide protein 2
MLGEVKMLWVGNTQVGIVGLDEILEQARAKGLAGDDLKAFLLEKTKARNYVAGPAEESYAAALLREYRRYCGEPVEDVPEGVVIVQVLGVGCSECDRLEQEVRNAMARLNIAGQVEHVRDPLKIAERGIFGGPALVVNGKVKSMGRVPPKGDIEKWLKEAQERK